MSELKLAGIGEVYVCGACGKVFKDPYKVDVSCMLNRVLCKEDSLEYDKSGRVIKVVPVEEEEHDDEDDIPTNAEINDLTDIGYGR